MLNYIRRKLHWAVKNYQRRQKEKAQRERWALYFISGGKIR